MKITAIIVVLLALFLCVGCGDDDSGQSIEADCDSFDICLRLAECGGGDEPSKTCLHIYDVLQSHPHYNLIMDCLCEYVLDDSLSCMEFIRGTGECLKMVEFE